MIGYLASGFAGVIVGAAVGAALVIIVVWYGLSREAQYIEQQKQDEA